MAAWRCSPGAGFGWPSMERRGWWAERGNYITVITQRLKPQSSILLRSAGRRGNAEITSSFVLRKERQTEKRCVRHIHPSPQWELNCWLGQKKKQGAIRKPRGWRCQTVRRDTAVGLHNTERERGENRCKPRGLNLKRTTRIDRCNQTHNKAGKRQALSNFLCKVLRRDGKKNIISHMMTNIKQKKKSFSSHKTQASKNQWRVHSKPSQLCRLSVE